MKSFHDDLKSRWKSLTIYEQMANIGAEVGRAISWKNKGNAEISRNAFYRALELIDFSVDAYTGKPALREILRMREMLVDYFYGDNEYNSTDEVWNKYFYYYNLAARS